MINISLKFTVFAVLLSLPAFSFPTHAQAHDSFQLLSASGAGVKAYADLLKDLDSRITSLQRRAAKAPGDWPTREHLASLLLEKAQLTGDVNDFAAIQHVLDEAFAIAPEGSGPMLVAARFNYSIHRLNQAEKYLDRMEHRAALHSDEPLAILIARSDINYHRGEYEKALSGYRRCEAASPGLCVTQLANFYSHTGGTSEAAALLYEALSLADAKDIQQRAWFKLQLGILAMQGGKYDEARKALADAENILPGWWLVSERSAQLLTLEGKWEEASALYNDVLRQTNLPQHMDALAGCYQHLGKAAEAEKLIAKAGEVWQEQLKTFPENASGHALDHFLRFGADAKQAVDIAEQNFKTRPGGEARVYLAQSYLKANRLQDARAMIETVMQTPFSSAELHDTARRAYEALGEQQKAEEQGALCLEVNPNYRS